MAKHKIHKSHTLSKIQNAKFIAACIRTFIGSVIRLVLLSFLLSPPPPHSMHYLHRITCFWLFFFFFQWYTFLPCIWLCHWSATRFARIGYIFNIYRPNDVEPKEKKKYMVWVLEAASARTSARHFPKRKKENKNKTKQCDGSGTETYWSKCVCVCENRSKYCHLPFAIRKWTNTLTYIHFENNNNALLCMRTNRPTRNLYSVQFYRSFHFAKQNAVKHFAP